MWDEKLTQPKVSAGGIEYSARGLVMYYNLICAARGFSMAPHLLPFAKSLTDRRIFNLMWCIGPGSGKALHPDTPVLCEAGWKPIREIKVGESVRCPDGVLTARVNATVIQPKAPLWRVRFADGRSVLAHANHEWLVHHKKMSRGEVGAGAQLWQLLETAEIAQQLAANRNLMCYVPLTEPVQLPAVELPISPYILGVILGDGSSDLTGYVRVTNPDLEIADELRKELPEGMDLTTCATNSSGCPNWGITGSGKIMTELGLRHKRSWEKFVPPEYKTGSVSQRLALLQGLMDTDGNVGDAGGANYSSTSFQLASDVQELVWSLGGMAKLVERRTYFTSHGIKKPGRKSWRVSIRVRDPGQLFRLPRKRDRAGRGQYSNTLKLHIKSIERDPVPQESVCISLDSADGLFIADNYVVTHNSTLLSEVYPGFELGHDPTMTILGISSGEALMQGFQRSVMEVIEWSPAFRRMFPKVKPDKSGGWSAERGMFITGREIGNPDAGYFVAGLDSKALTGKHARMIICDDIHDNINSQTIEQCDKLWATWHSTILGRADPRGCRYIVAGRRWNSEDLYKRLAATGEFVVIELPAERDNTKELWVDVTVPDGLECCFTEEGDDGVQRVNRPKTKIRRKRLSDPD